MTLDRYAGTGGRWAAGATLVYGPIARYIVATSPHSLAGRVVLDVGAGTGVACSALAEQGARPIGVDFSRDMLAWNAAGRPPAAVADICALPLADCTVDDCVAAFVLNHLFEPAAGFTELIRVTRPGGAVLGAVFANTAHNESRDRVDDTARLAGWQIPEWYLDMKAKATPILGTAHRYGQGGEGCRSDRRRRGGARRRCRSHRTRAACRVPIRSSPVHHLAEPDRHPTRRRGQTARRRRGSPDNAPLPPYRGVPLGPASRALIRTAVSRQRPPLGLYPRSRRAALLHCKGKERSHRDRPRSAATEVNSRSGGMGFSASCASVNDDARTWSGADGSGRCPDTSLITDLPAGGI